MAHIYENQFGFSSSKAGLVKHFQGFFQPREPEMLLNCHYLTSENITVTGDTAEGKWVHFQPWIFSDGSSVLRSSRLAASPVGCVKGRGVPLIGTRRVAALALLAFAQLIYSLDINIVFVALPEIGADLGFSGRTLQRVVSAYMVFCGSFLLFDGKAVDLIGQRRIFIFALWVYALSSVAADWHGRPRLSLRRARSRASERLSCSRPRSR